MSESDIAARLARLEQAFTDERRARQASEARLEATLQALTQAVTAAQVNLTTAIEAEQAERERQSVQQQADRTWLAALAEHVTVAQRENHDWVVAEQSARMALEAVVADIRSAQAGLLAAAEEHVFQATSGRAEILALGHIVEDLAAAVFPDSSPSPKGGQGEGHGQEAAWARKRLGLGFPPRTRP